MSLVIPIKPLILIGSSSSGRSAIIFHLTNTLCHKFERVITHTSRPKRQSERQNFHFYFVNQSQIKDHPDQFITMTKSINSNYYGLSKSQVQKVISNGRIPIFRLTLDAYKKNICQNTQGKFFISKQCVECNALYISMPDENQLKQRLKHSPFSQAQCLQKIQKAKQQQQEAKKFFIKSDFISSSNIEQTLVRVKSRLFQLY